MYSNVIVCEKMPRIGTAASNLSGVRVIAAIDCIPP